MGERLQMSKLIVSVQDKGHNTAGSKAKDDIVYFLGEQNFESVILDIPKKKMDRIGYSLTTVPRTFKHLEAEIIVLQYPLYSKFLTKKIIACIRKYTNARLLFVIHDVESLRFYCDNQESEKKELNFFNLADGLIVHNHYMRAWLKEHGVTTAMVDLEIFDYDNPQQFQPAVPYVKSVCFAGNLYKSKFLAKLTGKTKFYVFGPNPLPDFARNVAYCGQYAPDELTQHLEQNFGLVWDGSQIDSCDGVFGEYMKYNNPHKTSLYLSSGIPVIVWQQAAVAEFVVKHRVGLAVNSLAELDELLDQVSPKQYLEMKKNAVLIGKKMRAGEYIKHAFAQLEEKVANREQHSKMEV